jgi:hypothetical protein
VRGSGGWGDCGWWYGQLDPGTGGYAITNFRQWPCTVTNEGNGIIYGSVDPSVVIING